MISKADFRKIVARLGQQGRDDIAWANRCAPPADADAFAHEVIWVICNSGMRNTVAIKIFRLVMPAVRRGDPAGSVFGHKGKSAGIDAIWRDRARLMDEYLAAADKVAYARTLPWIGGITCYHVAKNFGAQVAKPDVHLQRLADFEGTTPQQLCERLARQTGMKVPAVDTVLWRACALGIIHSKTGRIT